MNIDTLAQKYETSIKKLSEKNNVEYELMLNNWRQKLETFDSITDEAGMMEDFQNFEKDSELPLVAITVNGSIIVASNPDDDNNRKVRYLSIKIRNDESKNVPDIFTGKLTKDIKIGGQAAFDLMSSSGVIAMKGAEDFDWEKFEDKAEYITEEVTKVFEQLDDEMITKNLDLIEA